MVFKQFSSNNPQILDLISKDIETSSRIKHENFLAIWDSSFNAQENELSYFTHFGDPLSKLINPDKPFHYMEIAQVLGQAFDFVDYLQKEFGISHTNIHPRNIIMHDGKFKLMDIRSPQLFALMNLEKNPEAFCKPYEQTKYYHAPELDTYIQNHPPLSIGTNTKIPSFLRADVYSLALVGLEMLGVDKRFIQNLDTSLRDEEYQILLQDIMQDIIRKNPTLDIQFLQSIVLLLNPAEEFRVDISKCRLMFTSYDTLSMIKQMDEKGYKLLTQERSKPKEALEHFQKSLDLKSKLSDNENYLMESHLNSYKYIAACHINLHDYPRAFEALENAKELIIQKEGPKSGSLAEIYQTIGSYYSFLGRYVEALANFEECLKLRQEDKSVEEWIIGQGYAEIGKCLHIMGRNVEAKEYYQKALTCYRKYPERAYLMVESYLGLASIAGYSSLDNKAEEAGVRPVIATALGIAKEIVGENSVEMAELSREIADIYRIQNKPKIALQMLESVDRIYKQQLGDQNEKLVQLKIQKVALMNQLGEFEKARELIDQAKIDIEILRADPRNYQTMLAEEMAEYYIGKGDLESAAKSIEQAMGFQEASKGEYSYELGRLLVMAADIQMKLGKKDAGIELGRKALSVLKKSVGDQNRETIAVQNLLDSQRSKSA